MLREELSLHAAEDSIQLDWWTVLDRGPRGSGAMNMHIVYAWLSGVGWGKMWGGKGESGWARGGEARPRAGVAARDPLGGHLTDVCGCGCVGGVNMGDGSAAGERE